MEKFSINAAEIIFCNFIVLKAAPFKKRRSLDSDTTTENDIATINNDR